MTKPIAEATKLTADIGTGVTIAEVNDSNSLIITAITILSRLVIEWVVNRRTRRQKNL